MTKSLRFSFLLAAFTAAMHAQTANGVSVEISTETVPAGGVAQIKLRLTEPKPIVRTSLLEMYEGAFFDAFLGISGAGGLTGVAQIQDGSLRLEMSSAQAVQLDPDYPILTLAVRTHQTLPAGRSTPVTLDLERSSWISPLGIPYGEEAKPGAVIIGGSFYISDVRPGGGTIPAGGRFEVLGGGFTQGLKVRAEGAKLHSVTPDRFIMEAKRTIRLDGLRITAEIGRERQVYYSYLRGDKRAPSTHPALRNVMPVFSSTAAHTAIVELARADILNAIGLQNPTGSAIEVTLTAASLFGAPLQSAKVQLGSRETMFQTAEEIFGAPLRIGAAMLMVSSAGAVQFTAAHISADGVRIAVPSVVTLRAATY